MNLLNMYLSHGGESSGSVVEHQTLEGEVGGLIPTYAVFCPSKTLYSPKVLVIPRKR